MLENKFSFLNLEQVLIYLIFSIIRKNY